MSESQGEMPRNGYENMEVEVVKHNLKMMNTEMLALLNTESIGGNAGSVVLGGKVYLCAGANGNCDPKTGKILAFGNYQQLDRSVTEGNNRILL